ncbi:LysR family transcriptional regulator [Novosphingobium sp. 9]|uniref:LysR family transcriptional regulator n=1 Tax=Novosphingobium sp. 9 TaxID=2025349 RepID=UPI0021B61D39|nr:LysR family transcriptional regulator [Novosphingobium sp. 9]
MDRLTTMTTFLKVVKYANFTMAADDLAISRTLVSRHVADLEAHLGIKLLNRTTRLVTPTEAGLRYSALCERVLGEIRNGEEQLAAIRDEIEGEISIQCPIWIGSFGISLATAEFAQLHPGVNIRIYFEEPSASHPHEFLAQGYDLCIQPNILRDSSIMVKKIGAIEHVLVAAPGYYDEREKPESVAQLAGHSCLAKLGEVAWSFENGERVTLPQPPRYTSNSVFALREAATSGLGIAMLPKGIVRQELEKGGLIEVLPELPVARRPLYIAFAPGGDAPRKSRALIHFLADWFKHRRFPV